MCYFVLLGTDSVDDLSQHDAGGVSFTRCSEGDLGADLLQLPHRWNVRAGDCSCGFRHLMRPEADFAFSEPVDWWKENDEDLVTTKQVIGVIRALVAEGANVECVDLWDGLMTDAPTTLDVDLGVVSDAAFRFFENHRFVFTNHSG